MHKRRVLIVAVSAICTIATIYIWLWLVSIPADPKNALFAGFSANRLVALISISVGAGFFAGIGLLSWKGRRILEGFAFLERSRTIPIIASLVLALIALSTWLLLLAPPPSLIPRPSALWDRVLPVLLWIGLISSQCLLIVASVSLKRLQEWITSSADRIRRCIARPSLGYLMLLLSALISATQVHYIHYNISDEGDTLAVGWLISSGRSLYSEIFSHHFPLPYLWVAAVVKLVGPSVFAVRFSLIMLRTLVFAATMKLSRYHFAIGLTALAWSLLGHLWLGNALLYQSFSGFFALGSFATVLAAVTRHVQPRFPTLIAAGSFIGLAVMSDPLKAFPAAVLVIIMALLAFSLKMQRAGPRIAVGAFGAFMTGLLVSQAIGLGYLLVSDGIEYFYRYAIEFNAEVYNKYTPVVGISDILVQIRSLLDVFNRHWSYYLSPYYEWETFEFLDQWVFAGFFFRATVVLGSVLLLANRKFLGAILMYFFGAAMLIRSTQFFHASPFVLLSLFCSSLIISGDLKGLSVRPGGLLTMRPRLFHWMATAVNALRQSARVVVAIAFIWMNIRGADYLLGIRSRLTFSDNFGGLQGNAGFLKKATCHLDQARVLLYPLDPIQYFLAEIPPASMYHFMTPWVAEVAQDKVISDLEHGAILVYLDRSATIWGYPVEQYLKKLIEYLDEQYVQIETGYYASPELLGACP